MSIREGLSAPRTMAKERRATVHMPRIGCGLAGGQREIVEALVRDELVAHEINVTVYDLP